MSEKTELRPKNTTASPRAVRLKDVAEYCGLGIATVSMALRDHQRFPAATTQRILAAAAELGYDPSSQEGARRLVMRRFGKKSLNNLIALALPAEFYRATYYALLFEGIMEVATEEGFGLLVVTAPPGGITRLPPSFSRGEVDGMLMIVGWDASQQLLTRLRGDANYAERPIVSVMAQLPGCSAVITNAQEAAYAEVEHLLQLGHRHFLYFRRPDGLPFGFHTDVFPAGYRQACLDHGLDPDTHLHPIDVDPLLWKIAFVAGDIVKLGHLNTLKWSRRHPLLTQLRQHPEITAILAPNDPSAVVIRHLLARNGWRVPEEYSVVGFDDTDAIFDDRGRNILTTVKVPLRTLGQHAARMLIKQLTTDAPREEQRVIPSRLQVRHSTGPARQGSLA